MAHWVAPLQDALHRAETLEQAFDVIAQGARQLGFEWCAYGYEYPLPFTRTDCFLVSNYAQCWRDRYVDAHYLAIDPTVAHARVSMEPMVWDDHVFCDAPQMWDEAQTFGLRHGWAQSCFAPNGAVGLLSLARGDEPLSQIELREKEARLRWLVNVAHVALSGYALRATRRQPRLTAREQEVLRWAGDGKTAEQMASILKMSPYTAEFHLKNAVRKLNAPTRIAGAAQAAALGLLR